MKLIVKFNLVFLLLFFLAVVACGYVSRELLQKNAREEIAESARLLMANALAVRAYTSTQIKPLLDTQMKYTFLPQSVPAYSATQVFHKLREHYPEYSYKEAMSNPTNPNDKAKDWEQDLINHFNNDARTSEVFGERDTPDGKVLYFARPLKISDPSCLQCHSTVDVAPRTMVEAYGPANGFGWKVNDIVGAQVVSVPTAVPLARAQAAFKTFMLSLVGVLVAIAVVLNLLLWWMFIRPVTKISALADRVSMGDLEAPDFVVRSHDEIRTLSESLARLRKSLVLAMQEYSR